jgi:hypothetical protein
MSSIDNTYELVHGITNAVRNSAGDLDCFPVVRNPANKSAFIKEVKMGWLWFTKKMDDPETKMVITLNIDDFEKMSTSESTTPQRVLVLC